MLPYKKQSQATVYYQRTRSIISIKSDIDCLWGWGGGSGSDSDYGEAPWAKIFGGGSIRARLSLSGAQVLIQFGAPLPAYTLKKRGGEYITKYIFVFVCKNIVQQHRSGKNLGVKNSTLILNAVSNLCILRIIFYIYLVIYTE